MNRINKKAFTIGIIVMLSLSSLLSMNIFFSGLNNDEIGNINPVKQVQSLKTSAVGQDSWWNESYQWRKCLEITNPGTYDLTDNMISMEIDHTDTDYSTRMRSDGMDVRIVENGIARNYHVSEDLPSTDILTIWFEVNSTASTTDYDTYIYFGNSSIDYRGSNHQNSDWIGEAWWKFEEGSGIIAQDSLENSYDATLVSNPLWDSSSDPLRGDYSLDFDGSGDFGHNFSKSYSSSNTITSMTASVWYKTSSGGGNWDNWAFLDFDRSEYFNFFLTGGGAIGFATSATGFSGQNDFFGSTNGLNDGQWHFACIVYDGTDKIIYLDDGVEDARWINAMGGRGFGTGTTRFGIIGDGSESDQLDSSPSSERNRFYYDGTMDDLRYWERALTQNEINWMANYYDLTITPQALTERAASVTIVVKDIDGRRISGAEVQLWNGTQVVNASGYTVVTSDSNGETVFTGVLFGNYNITVNYTITYDSSTWEQVVYNSSDIVDGEVSFIGLYATETVYTDLWTIDFDVDDYDGDPVTYGYVVVNASNQVLANLTLDSTDGTASFVWLYRSVGYNYTIYYYNRDIAFQPDQGTLLNWSTAVHSKTNLNYSISELNTNGGSTYQVDQSKYVLGSDVGSGGKNRLVDTTLTFSGMNDNISQIICYYLKPADDWIETLLYTSGEKYTQITYNAIDNGHTAYGMRFNVQGNNLSTCIGQVELNLTHTHVEHVILGISKLTIQVIDDDEGDPVPGVEIRIELNGTTDIIVDQTTPYGLTTNLTGYAKGRDNLDLVFWYKQGDIYNISTWFTPSNQVKFKVNSSDQMPIQSSSLYGYNYTLNSATTIVLQLDTLYDQRQLRFENYTFAQNNETAISGVTWNENFTIFANVSNTINDGVDWNSDDGVFTDLYCTFKTAGPGNPTVMIETFTWNSNGNFTCEINSSRLSAGSAGKTYIVYISAEKVDYKSPDPGTWSFTVFTQSTGIIFYEYNASDLNPDELTKYPVSQQYYTSTYYGPTLNITIRYFDDTSNQTLTPNTYTYTWDEGSGSLIQDAAHTGYWVLEFDTTTASESKEYTFYINIGLENYSAQNNVICKINVLEQQSLINGSDIEWDVDTSLYIFEEHIFTFNYSDSSGNALGSLDSVLSGVSWYAKNDDGSIKPPGPLTRGTGIVHEMANKLHWIELSVPTEDLPVGIYKINIDLKKEFYEEKEIHITLTIRERPIDSDQASLVQSGGQSGAGIDIVLRLTDSSNGSIPLTGVTVLIEIAGVNYTFDEDPAGTYTYTFPTTGYNTFFLPEVLTGTIFLVKENHETTTLPYTFTVNMVEIFPGMPMFWFLMIIGAIAAVAGSLIVNRVIQQKRIPVFVKKGKTMMKAISSNSKILDSMVYPVKDKFIAEMYADDWKTLDLSIEDQLGIEKGKKGLKLDAIKKNPDGGAV